MLRALFLACIFLSAGAGSAAAEEKAIRLLLPTEGMWQSIPYGGAFAERWDAPATPTVRANELARRLEALAPGAKLDEPMADPDNPAWRRKRADRAGAESSDFAVPIDATGAAGFVARGYHQPPGWNNLSGNIGATLSLRRKF